MERHTLYFFFHALFFWSQPDDAGMMEAKTSSRESREPFRFPNNASTPWLLPQFRLRKRSKNHLGGARMKRILAKIALVGGPPTEAMVPGHTVTINGVHVQGVPAAAPNPGGECC